MTTIRFLRWLWTNRGRCLAALQLLRMADDDEVGRWAIDNPAAAYGWLTSGYVLESSFPAVVEHALSRHAEAERAERERVAN